MNATKKLTDGINDLSEYYSGCSITHSSHWSHGDCHRGKFQHWYYLYQFGTEFLTPKK
jgi:hypothetical protein